MTTPRGWLLDTVILSELRKGRRTAPPVRLWAERLPRVACFISRVNIAEIRYGIETVADPAFRAELEAWLQDGVLAWFGPRILDVDEAVLLRWRHLAADARKINHTYPQLDVLIAATALVHGLGVATRNVQDFVRTGVPVLNPWDEPA